MIFGVFLVFTAMVCLVKHEARGWWRKEPSGNRDETASGFTRHDSIFIIKVYL